MVPCLFSRNSHMEFRLGDTQNMAEHLFSPSRLMSRRGTDAARRMNVAQGGSAPEIILAVGVAITH